MILYKELVERLINDYPQMKFKVSKRFKYRPSRTIYYEMAPEEMDLAEQKYYSLQILHELGHALCGHRDFATDCERVKMECEAWNKAEELCMIYQVPYDEDFVETQLDSYRDWLHQRSRCAACGLTRYQTEDGVYHCPYCEQLGH